MLATTLVTNEIKNAAGTEEEFQRLGPGTTARSSLFARVGEQPALPHRFTISHNESGTGVDRRRRSVIRFDKTVTGQIDITKLMRGSSYIVLDRPIGQETTDALVKDLLANLMSLCASLGASSTILFDCTGNGASNLVSGGV
jgi:hypothetical protein